MKARGLILFALGALGTGVPAFGTLSYTCDASVNATVAGLCNALNTTVAGFYNSTFTNANASIYIQIANNGGLGESTVGFQNLQTYAAYQTKLQTESTDAARLTLSAGEPAIFGTGQVELTSALKDAMGIGGTTVGVQFLPTGSGGNAGNGWAGAACFTPGDGATSTTCYNGIITIELPADLPSNQGYFFPGLQAGSQPLNYDFYSILQHETDEVLGTTSCIDRSASALSDGCNAGAGMSVNDLFRYSAAGVRTFKTTGGTQYFSADGGVTDFEGNVFPSALGTGDWADFNSSCKFVQDSSGCLSTLASPTQFNITTDGPGGINGPEIAMLNAVGYNLASLATPEPGTVGLLGLSLVALVLGRNRLRRN